MTQLLDPEVIEREGHTVSLKEATAFVADQLTKQATAYVCGLKEVQQISKWISGDAHPGSQLQRVRLRTAYTAARMIVSAYDTATVEAWFFGSNSRLDDESPAWVLRHAESVEDLRMVVPAAKAFARASE